MINTQGIQLIKHFEGFAAECYRCPAGLVTIGYGHVVREREDFSGGITRSEAEMLLQQDVLIAERAVVRYITVPLNSNQYAALCSFTYNLGAACLQRSTLRRKINRAEHGDVPQELMRFVWAGGRKLAGLVARRQAEGELYKLP
jgi:lysozyme